MGFCGIDFGLCPAFAATQANDDAKRREVAQEWSERYGADIKPEDVNCDGCVSDFGKKFSHCQECEIRKCGFSKAGRELRLLRGLRMRKA